MKKALFVSLLLLAVLITLSSQLSLLLKLCNLIIGGEPLLEEEITSRKMRRKRKRHVAAAGPWDEYHNLNASFTFPSVKQRIVYYFGTTWCNETITGPNSIDTNDLMLHKIKCNPLHYQHDDQAIMSLSTLLALPADGSNILRNSLIAMYEYLENIQPQTPLGLLLQVGDNMQHQKQISFPLMMKSRKARDFFYEDDDDDNEFATEPILLPINFNRHFQPVWDLEDYIKKAKLYAKYGSTRKYPSWDEKYDTILWRGSNTGGAYDHGGERFVFLRKFYGKQTPYHPVSFDIGYSEVFGQDDDIYAPEIMKEMKSYLKNELRISDMVQYKYFLSIEGNDVASDLKWKLYSNSVVFMKPPTKVTWAMEDYLIPWYHYVPLVANSDNDDDDIYPDLMEKLSWAHSHPQECQKIATQSTDYIHRLLISDQAKADQRQILKYMLNSYQERFGNYFYNFCQNRTNSDTINNNGNHNDTLVVIGE